jgi:hypothetical protein
MRAQKSQAKTWPREVMRHHFMRRQSIKNEDNAPGKEENPHRVGKRRKPRAMVSMTAALG